MALDKLLQEKRDELRAFSQAFGLRDDWHEPDNQSVVARVVGDHLDNAFGEHISFLAVEEGRQEFVVIIQCNDTELAKDKGVNRTLSINLATLLALACDKG